MTSSITRHTAHEHWSWNGLFLAILLFIIFDCLFLVLNYQMTFEAEHTALAINVAGRQRMLTQQQAKSLLEIKYRLDNVLPINQQIDELNYAHALFSETMDAFAYGGEVMGTNRKRVQIKKLDDDIAQSIIEQAQIDVTPLSWVFSQFSHNFQLSQIDFDLAIDTASKQSAILLDLMNRLTTRMQQLSNAKMQDLRLIQGVVFSIALANFMYIISLFQKRIRLNRDSIDSMSQLINHINHAILGLNRHGRIIMHNSKATEVFGYSDEEIDQLLLGELITPSTDDKMGIRADGRRFPIQLERSSINMLGQELKLYEIRDVSVEWECQLELTRLASRDALTDTVNRRGLFEQLEVEIANAARNDTPLGLVFIDLDHFKPVNDDYGHSIGDQLLVLVSRRMKGQIRANDTLSRYGGDEFVILYHNVADAENLKQMAQHLIDAISEPFHIDGHVITIGASLGLAFMDDAQYTGLELLHFADHAMYQAKRAGGNSLVLSAMDSNI